MSTPKQLSDPPSSRSIRASSSEVQLHLVVGENTASLQLVFFTRAECVDITGIPLPEVPTIEQMVSEAANDADYLPDAARNLLALASQFSTIRMQTSSTRMDRGALEAMAKALAEGQFEIPSLASVPHRLHHSAVDLFFAQKRYDVAVAAVPFIAAELQPEIVRRLIHAQQHELLSRNMAAFGSEARGMIVRTLQVDQRGELLVPHVGLAASVGTQLDPLDLCLQAARQGPAAFRSILEQWGSLHSLYAARQAGARHLGNALVEALLSGVAKGEKSSCAWVESGLVSASAQRWGGGLVDATERGRMQRCLYYDYIRELLERGCATEIPARSACHAVNSRISPPPTFLVEHSKAIKGDADELLSALVENRFVVMVQDNIGALLDATPTHAKFALTLVKRGFLSLLRDQIAHVRGLGREVLVALIQEGQGRLVQEHRDCFTIPAEEHATCARELLELAARKQATFQLEVPFKLLQGLPLALAHEVLALPRKQGEQLLPQLVGSFEDAAHSGIARELVTRRRLEYVERLLPAARALDLDIMVHLLDGGYVRSVFTNIGAFKQVPRESLTRIHEVLRRRLAQNDIRPIVEVLDRIPAPFLEPFEDEFAFLAYHRSIGVPSPALYDQFRGMHDVGDTAGMQTLGAQLAETRDALLSPDELPEGVVTGQLFRVALEASCPAHGGRPGVFARVFGFEDRTSDVSSFVGRGIEPLMVGSGVRYALSQSPAEFQAAIDKLSRLTEPLIEVVRGADTEADREAAVLGRIPRDQRHVRVAPRNVEDTLYQHLRSVATGKTPSGLLKEALLAYVLATTENPATYAALTRDRASASENPEYASLLEWRDLFGRLVREGCQAIVSTALQNGELLAVAHEKYEDFVFELEKQRRLDGLRTGGGGRLEQQGHFLSEVERICRRSEPATDRLRQLEALLQSAQSATGTSVQAVRTLVRHGKEPPEQRIEAIIARIQKHREEIVALLHRVGQTDIAASQIHLASITIADLVRPKRDFRLRFQLSDYRALLTEVGCRIFASELQLIDTQLGKIVPTQGSGTGRSWELEAVISKNRAAAQVAANAGLCIAEDLFHWRAPEHFRMPLRVKETRRWEGGCLFWDLSERREELGERVLIISPNPTASLLYQVDGRALFRAMMERIIRFATANPFDAIGVSSSPHMQTNRVGTDFQLELQEWIAAANERRPLKTPYPISKAPEYWMEAVDIIWRRAAV